jgi:Rieske Fe-S protein
MDQTLPDLQAGAAVPEPAPTRRHVLALVTVTGAGGALLTACGGGGDDTAGTDTPAAGGSASSDGAASPSESAAGGALVATSKVPVGGGVILDKQRIVVTQPTDGSFKAFSAVCTHMSCLVGSVKDGTISCPCHGSAYSAADGSVKNGPATRALKEVPISVEGGQVVEA